MDSARKHFMEKGFRDASIRNICKDAGVTNGAFYAHFASKEELFDGIVASSVEGLNSLYSGEEEQYMTVKSTQDVIDSFLGAFNSSKVLIKYVCDHREDFTLVIKSGSGTHYEGFVDMLIDEEVNATMNFLKKSKRYVKTVDKISPSIIRFSATFLISTIFDGIVKGLSEKEILHEIKILTDYCIAGYKMLLGI